MQMKKSDKAIRDELSELLNKNNRAVERAIVVLFERQTQDEQNIEDAIYRNNQGFSGSTVKRGSYYARWIMSGKHLSGKYLDNARKIAQLHIRQLVDLTKIKRRLET